MFHLTTLLFAKLYSIGGRGMKYECGTLVEWYRHGKPKYAQRYNLMFFWPCIMNWLYIYYQLDALIIIYS